MTHKELDLRERRAIEPDRSNIRHDRSPLWIITDPRWHIDAVGGRLHHQSLA